MKPFNMLYKLISYLGQRPYAIFIKELEEIRIIFPNRDNAFTIIIPPGNFFYYEKGVTIPEREDFEYIMLSRMEITGVYVAYHYIDTRRRRRDNPLLGNLNVCGPLGAIYPISGLDVSLKSMIRRLRKGKGVINKLHLFKTVKGDAIRIFAQNTKFRLVVELNAPYEPVYLTFVRGRNGYTVSRGEVTDITPDQWTELKVTKELRLALFDLHYRVQRWLNKTEKADMVDRFTVVHPNAGLPNSVKEMVFNFYADNHYSTPISRESYISRFIPAN